MSAIQNITDFQQVISSQVVVLAIVGNRRESYIHFAANH
jgi:hypothetical protein